LAILLVGVAVIAFRMRTIRRERKQMNDAGFSDN
jgi:hypothetical protein